jgi:hypothetical protein
MAKELQGKKIAFLAADGVEQIELTEPWKAVEQAGGEPELLSTESGKIQGFNHLDHGDTFTVDKEVAKADPADYDGLAIFAQKAGRSSGLRLETSPASTTTSSSTQFPPALRMSVCRLGQDVILRPLTSPASTSVHGPWQMTPTGLPCSKKRRTKPTAFSSVRRKSGLATPPGSTRPS